MCFPKPRSLVLLYTLCAPWDISVLFLGILLAPAFGFRCRARRGVLWLCLGAHTFLAKYWRYSTTFGHVVLLQQCAEGTDVEDHELVHVRQFEGAVLSLWLAAACFFGFTALFSAVWGCTATLLLGPWWSYFGASLCALLRGERAYLDNHFESHARAEVALAAVHYASSEKGVKSVARS